MAGLVSKDVLLTHFAYTVKKCRYFYGFFFAGSPVAWFFTVKLTEDHTVKKLTVIFTVSGRLSLIYSTVVIRGTLGAFYS
jgi:hypothetical protein